MPFIAARLPTAGSAPGRTTAATAAQAPEVGARFVAVAKAAAAAVAAYY